MDKTGPWHKLFGSSRAPAGALAARVLGDYQLDFHGIHGPGHWLRVAEYGRRLAAHTGADPELVALFALLHDSCRRTDRGDPAHGARAAAYARRLAAEGALQLPAKKLELLCRACAEHTGGRTADEPTVGTCWDADRLDLHRFGWQIDPDRLSTAAAVAFVTAPAPSFVTTFL